MNTDLKVIKKKYGEKMMHLCRELFSTLLEKEGLLSELLLEHFSPNNFLYNDIVESKNVDNFKNYIYNLVNKETKLLEISKTPKELLKEVGYILYECKTESDIQSFKKYYTKDEELCTFCTNRLDNNYVFFAIKSNVEEIRRERFPNPERQDEYGTSVISIQFTKGKINTLSIKNRYNHTVNNPDATYSNNLENIIEGLTRSFEREYKLNINQNNDNEFELPNYVRAKDGKYYKYNYEINNIYYCPNNIIIDNFQLNKYDHEKYIMLDYFILDLVNKEIKLYDKELKDSFIDTIKDIEKISIVKNQEKSTKEIEITTYKHNKIIIELDIENNIIKYINNEVTYIGDNFLHINEKLIMLELKNLEYVGNYFLHYNEILNNFNAEKLKQVGNCCLKFNKNLVVLNFNCLEFAGHQFLTYNKKLTKVNFPNLERVGDFFLFSNNKLMNINFQSLIRLGYDFLYSNEYIKKIYAPNLEERCVERLEERGITVVRTKNINKNKKLVLKK